MRYLILFILLLTCGKLSVLAQKAKIDSLHNEIRKYPQQDTVKVELLIDLAYRYYQSYPDSTLLFAQKGLVLAERLKYRKGIGRAYNRIAIAYSVKGRHAQGLEYYFKSLKIAEELKDEKGISSALNNIGYLLRLQKKYKESFEYTFQALSISQRNQNTAAMAVNLSNLGWLYENTGDYEKALGYALRGVKMAETVGDNYHSSISRHIVGKVYTKQGKYDLALKHYGEALQKAELAQIQQQIAFNHLGLGEVYLIKNNFVESEPHLLKAIQIAQQIKTPEILQDASRALVNLYRSKKDYNKALEFNDIYNIAKDSTFAAEQRIQINKLEYEFEAEKNKKEIALLAKENEFQVARNEMFLNWIYGALGLVFLISILAFKLFQSRQKQWQANRLLAFQKIDLEKKNSEIDEQNKAIKLQAEQLQEMNKLKDRLFSIIAHDLRNPVAALRNTIDILDPSMLNTEELTFIKDELTKQFNSMDFTLTNLLEWTKNQIRNEDSQKNTIDVFDTVEHTTKQFQVVAKLKNISLHNQVPQGSVVCADSNHLRIIFRNLLDNAIKFTPNGGIISVAATSQDNQLLISVKDTGIGISKEKQAKLFSVKSNFSTLGTEGEKGTGLGLILCKEFIEKNGGKIWIESELGRGSTFYFTLKLKEFAGHKHITTEER
jgi:signal transduction histidine kinase